MFPHQVLVNGVHLIAGLLPVVFSSLLDRLLWDPSKHKTAHSDYTCMLTLIYRWELTRQLRILVSPYRLPSFSELSVHIHLVILTTKCGANPTMLVTRRCFRCLQLRWRCPRLAPLGLCARFRFAWRSSRSSHVLLLNIFRIFFKRNIQTFRNSDLRRCQLDRSAPL